MALTGTERSFRLRKLLQYDQTVLQQYNGWGGWAPSSGGRRNAAPPPVGRKAPAAIFIGLGLVVFVLTLLSLYFYRRNRRKAREQAAREAQEAANADHPKPEPVVPERLINVVVIMPDCKLQCGLRLEEESQEAAAPAAAAAEGKRTGDVIELTASSGPAAVPASAPAFPPPSAYVKPPPGLTGSGLVFAVLGCLLTALIALLAFARWQERRRGGPGSTPWLPWNWRGQLGQADAEGCSSSKAEAGLKLPVKMVPLVVIMPDDRMQCALEDGSVRSNAGASHSQAPLAAMSPPPLPSSSAAHLPAEGATAVVDADAAASRSAAIERSAAADAAEKGQAPAR